MKDFDYANIVKIICILLLVKQMDTLKKKMEINN